MNRQTRSLSSVVLVRRAAARHAVRCLLASLGMIALIGLAATTAHGGTILIDDFVDPIPAEVYVIDALDPNPKVIESAEAAGTILGGERDLQMVVVAPDPPGPVSATGTIGGGSFTGNFDFGAASTASVVGTLQYDGSDPGSDVDGVGLSNSFALGSVDLTDGGSNTEFRLDFFAVDPAPSESFVDLEITVTSGGLTATFLGGIPGSADPSMMTVPFASFAGDLGALSAADSLTFVINGADPDPAVDFVLTRISVVPEPTTLFLTLIGTFGLIAWTQRRTHPRK